MKDLYFLEDISHRSRDRIKDLGEVFTPEIYVEEMLNILSKQKAEIWSDENIVFFEPCSGHGNIIIPIYKRRLECIYQKEVSNSAKVKDAAFYAVANSLNTIWAIDIDLKNVENCRSRLLIETIGFLKSKLDIKNEMTLIHKEKEFFAHILSTIMWQIHENECLSALNKSVRGKTSTLATKAGTKWQRENSPVEINFDLTWASYFLSLKSNHTTPIEYKRSIKYIDAALANRLQGFEDFSFAKVVMRKSLSALKINENANSVI